MSDYDKNLWCPKCNKVQTFSLSGSGRKGMCLECDWGFSNGYRYALLNLPHRLIGENCMCGNNGGGDCDFCMARETELINTKPTVLEQINGTRICEIGLDREPTE